jgi:hypothetical protein
MIEAGGSIEVAVAIEDAWRTLTDLPSYPLWNPFVVRIESGPDPVRVGDRLRLHVRWPDGRGGERVDELVTTVHPPTVDAAGVARAEFAYRYVSWLGRLGLVRAVRTQVLTQPPGGPTTYTTREEFQGPLARFVPLARVQAGFDAQLQAMRAWLERTA